MTLLERLSSVSTPAWGMFVILALVAVFIALGVPGGPIALLFALVAFLFAYRYIYTALYVGIALTPFLGITISIPTGSLALGERAFGGSIDISLAEAILFFVLAAWGVKLLFLWHRRRDLQWKPRWPLLESSLGLVAAHLASAFSPLGPDPVPVVKYAMRPILFNYLAFIALPVNLIHSRKRFLTALGIVAAVGTFAAATGFVSIFVPGPGAFFGRAHPIPIFGVGALGENHNELAEILVFTALATAALAELAREDRSRDLLRFAAAFQFFIGLLTFTRTAWIVFILQGVFLFSTIWREKIKEHLRALAIIGLLLLPLVVGMIAYSVSESASSSNSTRLMLSQIALELFVSSPWFGGGAGTFLDRVGSTRIFVLEYGNPLDSHGVFQKLAAETGILGLLAYTIVLLQLAWLLWRGWRSIGAERGRRAFILLVAGVGGALVYQIFNTDYWTGKMWLPVGIALAAITVLKELPHDIVQP